MGSSIVISDGGNDADAFSFGTGMIISSPTNGIWLQAGGPDFLLTAAGSNYLIQSQVRYVSTTGSDSNDGLTTATPWLTLAHAFSAIGTDTSGYTIQMRGGTYYLSSTLTLTSQSNIEVVAYPGETVIISGGQSLSGWALDGSNDWYKATLNSATRDLFVTNVAGTVNRCVRACTAAKFSPAPTSYTTTQLLWSGNNCPVAGLARPQDAEIVYPSADNFMSFRIPISTVDPAGGSITPVAAVWSTANNSWGQGSFAANVALTTGSTTQWVENDYTLMGTAGQFYRNPATNTIYYKPRGLTGTMANMTWVADGPSALSQTSCLSANAAGTKITMPTPTGIYGVTAISFEIWVKNVSAASQKTLVAMGTSGSSPHGWDFSINSTTQVTFECFAGNMTYNVASLADGAWHHFLVTKPFNGNLASVKVYHNGTALALTSSASTTLVPSPNNVNLIIGDYFGGSQPYIGLMAHFSIWDQELLASDATALAAGNAASVNPIYQYKMTEGSGTIIHDSGRTSENVSSMNAVASVLQTLVDMTSCTNIKFNGIQFQHTSWLDSITNGALHHNGGFIASCDANGFTEVIKGVPGAVQMHACSFCSVEFSQFHHIGGNSVLIDQVSTDCNVFGNQFDDLAAGAAFVGDNVTDGDQPSATTPHPGPCTPNLRIRVSHNYVTNYGLSFHAANAIHGRYSVQNCRFNNNDIGLGTYMPMHIRGLRSASTLVTYNNRCDNNFVHHFQWNFFNSSNTTTAQSNSDGGGIYSNGIQASVFDGSSTARSTGLQQFNNGVFGCPFNGIYHDNSSSGCTAIFNIVDDFGKSYLNNGTLQPCWVSTNYFPFTVQVSSAPAGNVSTPNTLDNSWTPQKIHTMGPDKNLLVNQNSVTDTFVGTNGTTLASRGWTSQDDTSLITIQSNLASCSSDRAVVTKNLNNYNQTQALAMTYSNAARLPVNIVRWYSWSDFIYGGPNAAGNAVVVNLVAAGTVTQLVSIPFTWAATVSHTLELMAVGQSMRISIDGVLYGSLDGGVNGILATLPTNRSRFGMQMGFGIVGDGAGGAGTCTFGSHAARAL